MYTQAHCVAMWALPYFTLEVGHPPPRWRRRRCLASAATGRARLELKGFSLAVSLLAMIVFSPFVGSILAKINEEKEHPYLCRKAVYQNTALRVYHTVQPSTHTVLVGTAGRPVLAWGVACLLCAGRPISSFGLSAVYFEPLGFDLSEFVRWAARTEQLLPTQFALMPTQQNVRRRGTVSADKTLPATILLLDNMVFQGHVICQGQQNFEVWH